MTMIIGVSAVSSVAFVGGRIDECDAPGTRLNAGALGSVASVIIIHKANGKISQCQSGRGRSRTDGRADSCQRKRRDDCIIVLPSPSSRIMNSISIPRPRSVSAHPWESEYYFRQTLRCYSIPSTASSTIVISLISISPWTNAIL
jgi:hypothetical protein